ncbi:MAG: urate hydroxylase PuuD [Elusimicrobia bacterium]|nr:urate hydroxylase PuuD [Elusimicrobiota bacterium]
MAYADFYTNFHLFMRWLHVIAGIAWIGHLYFFNFVNVPLQGALDDAAKKAVNPKLMPRALWWFRWGAMVTFLAGLILFTMIYMYTPGMGFGPSASFSDEMGVTGRGVWILMGMLLGTIMWFNVWFVIWPIQKKILSGRASAEELPALRKRAGLFSRTNTYLSGPMLFGMLAANHYSAINGATLIVFVAVSLAAVWVAIFHAGRVGQSV